MSICIWGSITSFALALVFRKAMDYCKAKANEERIRTFSISFLVMIGMGTVLLVSELARLFLQRGQLVSIVITLCLAVLAWCFVMVITPKEAEGEE